MRPVSSVSFLILSFTNLYTQINPNNVQNVDKPNTNVAEVNLYKFPLLKAPKSRPTKTAASIRAILMEERKIDAKNQDVLNWIKMLLCFDLLFNVSPESTISFERYIADVAENACD